MVTITDDVGSVEIELPFKIEHKGKEYWVKEATKNDGIYMNCFPPKTEMIVKESDSVTISQKLT